MSLPALVAEVFAPEGVLARHDPGFRPRSGQTDMAHAVAQTLAQGGTLVVEAGTGVGKTYAYLVPVLLSGHRALISTATKTLQDQLFGRDLPGLLRVLGLPVRLALLKGRGSYVCLHRLGLARQELWDTASTRALARIERWALTSTRGDLAELPGLDDNSPLLPRITSTRDNCLGSTCPQAANCHVNLARREAMAADVVVINHHLFFADMAVRESGVAELLPSVNAVIFDEAHQLNETGVQFLGLQFSSAQWLDFARDMLATGQAQARGYADWHVLSHGLTSSLEALRQLVGTTPKKRWVDEAPEGVHAGDWQDAVHTMQTALQAAQASLQLLGETAPELTRLATRAQALLDKLAQFAMPVQPGHVRWLESANTIRWIDSPLDIAASLGPLTHNTQGLDKAADTPNHAPNNNPDSHSGKAWIFTSATLGDDPELRWFTTTAGLASAQCLQVPSPFDYPAQAALWVPPDLPKPSDPAHSAAVAAKVRTLADAAGGRTLVLTTTLKAMRQIAASLRQNSTLEVLLQGEGPKRELIERFVQAGQGTSTDRGCVLVASASFWEGVDIPGQALQCVVIDKLPFPPPGDPLVDARAEQLEAQGRQPFMDFWVPQAAVALKQGAGRLIRSETDQGLLVIGDTRLIAMAYGKRLLRALPPMQRLSTQDEALAWLAQITKTATKA